MATKSNPFKRAAGQKPASGSGTWITDGDYDYLIERLVMKEEGYKGDSFTAELRVEKAKQIIADVKPNPEGSSVSFTRVLDDDFKYQLMMAFMYEVAVATGDDLEAMNPQQLEDWLKLCCSKEQPCRGVRISNRTKRTKTRAGQEITANQWRAVEQTGEEIAAGRAKLDE